MFRKSFFVTSLVLMLSAKAFVQAASPATAGGRRATSIAATAAAAATGVSTTRPAQETAPVERIKKPIPRTSLTPKTGAPQSGTAQARAVREAFDSLVDGIRRADAEDVMKLYWASPQLAIFNNNGTVTRGWEQAHSNRVSLYEKTKDVKLDVRDVRVKTLGLSAALITCAWDQTQTANGQPEHATGRLTLVYQKIGADWKIVHAHTSPDKPSPSNILPSERMPEMDTTPLKPPAKPETDKMPAKR